jgi:hypothetical protein
MASLLLWVAMIAMGSGRNCGRRVHGKRGTWSLMFRYVLFMMSCS